MPTPQKATAANLFHTAATQRNSLCCRNPAQKKEKQRSCFLCPHMHRWEPVKMGDVQGCAQDVLVGVS